MPIETPKETVIKVVFVGEPNSGKSEIIKKHLKLDHIAKPTVFDTYRIRHGDSNTFMNICDTNGSEELARLVKMSYLDADVFVLCIECVNAKDNLHFQQLMKELRRPNKPIILAVTKCDKTVRGRDEQSGEVVTSDMVTSNLELVRNNAHEMVNKQKLTSYVLVSNKRAKSVQALFDEVVRVYFDEVVNRGVERSCCGCC
ncbi:RAC7 [Enterospora canceri]|uniref:RAC7 n=1 Tax=Enterospora canceri TaxID=1081671 RepID=A0A1Y1S756_9MICR|nr:RAC7 [Enterospora canceri]